MTDKAALPTGPRFPEPELRELAEFFAFRANSFRNAKGEGEEIARHSKAAEQTIRDAIQSHDDLRDRCLTAEVQLIQATENQRSVA